MFNGLMAIRLWWDERKDRHRSFLMDSGYGWAATGVLRHGMSVRDIEILCDGNDPFDRGAREFLSDYEREF